MLMLANDTNKRNKLIHPELSYAITGICFDIHNQRGRFLREKQYGDFLEEKLVELKLPFQKEYRNTETGNILDFLIDDKIVLEIKAKRMILKEDYYQLQRYLQSINKKLGLLVNFRYRYLKPLRIVKIETDTRSKFV